MSKPNIAIIGGGIGGIAVAAALRRRNFNTVVYEKSERLREAGAGLMLWANATRVLREMDLLDTITEQSGIVDRFLVRTSGGQILMNIAIGNLDVPSVCVPRNTLLKTLLTAVSPEQIRVDHRLLSLEQSKDKVYCYFENGISEEYDAVIGADGIHSRVRAGLFGKSEPVDHGYTVWRGITDYHGHALRAGTNSETWGSGRRFGILNTGQDRVTWYATANLNGDHSYNPAERKQTLLKAFGDWHEPVRDLIESTNEDLIMENRAADLARLPSWGQGLVTLLGDAAHPCTPNLGQGGGLAIEDAMVLAKCLSHEPSLKSALRRYENLRRKRTAHIQQRARLMGSIGQWENSLMVSGRRIITRLLPAKIFEYNLRRVYSYQT